MRLLTSVSVVLSITLIFSTEGQADVCDCCGYRTLETNISPSARLNGMGEVGVAIVGPHAHWYNPAALGLVANTHRAAFSFFPVRSSYQKEYSNTRNFQFLSGSIGVLRQGEDSRFPFSAGVAFYRTDIRQSRNLVFDGQTRVDAASLGLAHRGLFELAIGGTVKRVYLDEIVTYGSFAEHDLRSDAFDLGAMVRWSLDLERSGDTTRLEMPITLGTSWFNLGEDELDRWLPYAEPGGLQFDKRWRIGLSVGLVQELSRRVANSLLFAFEYERAIARYSPADADEFFHTGVEIGIEDALFLRMGQVRRLTGDRQLKSFTTGLTISSEGIFGTPTIDPSDTGSGGLMDKLVFEFSIAYYPKRDDALMYKSSFLSLDIAWRY